MSILALYDTTEIQRYVYSSNKLRDNIGASLLVEDCFNLYLVEAMKNKIEQNDCITEWKNINEFMMPKRANIKAEILYIGGGNALVIYKDKDLWKSVNSKFSELLIENVPGLNFVTEYVEITDNFKNDMDNLFEKLNEKKAIGVNVNKFKGISITRECFINKTPASECDNGVYISEEVYKKREKNKLFEKNNKYSCYNEIDSLGGAKGESYVAVVHIDGNNMGKKIGSVLEKSKDYEQSILNMRKFSKDIQEIYETSYNEMLGYVEKFIDNHKDEFKQFIYEKAIAPFRKILIKGDDITFICYGKFALSAIKVFFEKLNSKIKEYGYSDLNACAGVAFVKPHFPFNKAYEIAEQCCSNAKKAAKAADGDESGNYIDFHLVSSEIGTDLSRLREKEYNVSYIKPTPKNNGYSTYNLLWRPYKITFNKEYESHSYELLFKLIELFNKIPRSKIKNLRNSFIMGESELAESIKVIKSRKETKNAYEEIKQLLSDYRLRLNENELFDEKENSTPIFDALEIMDLYIKF